MVGVRHGGHRVLRRRRRRRRRTASSNISLARVLDGQTARSHAATHGPAVASSGASGSLRSTGSLGGGNTCSAIRRGAARWPDGEELGATPRHRLSRGRLGHDCAWRGGRSGQVCRSPDCWRGPASRCGGVGLLGCATRRTPPRHNTCHTFDTPSGGGLTTPDACVHREAQAQPKRTSSSGFFKMDLFRLESHWNTE